MALYMMIMMLMAFVAVRFISNNPVVCIAVSETLGPSRIARMLALPVYMTLVQ